MCIPTGIQNSHGKIFVHFDSIGLEQKFVAFFSSKISIFYKISMTPFDRAVSAFRICFTNYGTTIFNGVMSDQSQKSLFNLTCE